MTEKQNGRSSALSANILKRSEKIDRVILDMIMPDMSGGETYSLLKEINPSIRTLLSSGYSINGKAQAILNDGYSGFIQKPFNLTDLSHKIGKILGLK